MPDFITTFVAVINTILAFVSINPLYDMSLGINITNPKLFADENLTVSVFLEKFNRTVTNENITISLNYTISNRRSTISSGSLGTVKVNDSVQELFNISTSDISSGKYTLSIKATQDQSNPSEDSEEFSKTRKSAKFEKALFSNIFNLVRSFFGIT